MGVVIIIGLVVAVIALLIVNSQLKKENLTLQEPTKKARKGRKNATKL